MTWNVYLSGEIHSDWRKQIIDGVTQLGIRSLALLARHLRTVVIRRWRQPDHLARPRDRANNCLGSMYPLDLFANGEFG